MNIILYCVFRDFCKPLDPDICGPGKESVKIVSRGGLAGAVSEISGQPETPKICDLVNYQKVVSGIFRDRTVIPMRFGSFFSHEDALGNYLDSRGDVFLSKLKELDGCAEMGIRIRLDTHEIGAPGELKKTAPARLKKSSPGSEYLAKRRTHYDRMDSMGLYADKLSRRCQEFFSGICENSRVESGSQLSGNHAGLISLYFLVRRSRVAEFQEVFRDKWLGKSLTSMLSGPWPPYNFVCRLDPGH